MDRFQTRWEGAERHGGGWTKNQALPEAGRRSRGRALSDERSKELARQDERQPDSRSLRPAAKPVHHRSTVEIDVLEKHMVLHVIPEQQLHNKAGDRPVAGLLLKYQCGSINIQGSAPCSRWCPSHP